MPPCARALWSCSGQGVWLREGDPSSKSVSDSSFSSTFFFSTSLVWLLRHIFNGSIMVVWAFLFCVATNAYWRVLLRFGLWHTCAPNFVSFLCMPAGGATVLKMASEKPLLVVNVFSDF